MFGRAAALTTSTAGEPVFSGREQSRWSGGGVGNQPIVTEDTGHNTVNFKTMCKDGVSVPMGGSINENFYSRPTPLRQTLHAMMGWQPLILGRREASLKSDPPESNTVSDDAGKHLATKLEIPPVSSERLSEDEPEPPTIGMTPSPLTLAKRSLPKSKSQVSEPEPHREEFREAGPNREDDDPLQRLLYPAFDETAFSDGAASKPFFQENDGDLPATGEYRRRLRGVVLTETEQTASETLHGYNGTLHDHSLPDWNGHCKMLGGDVSLTPMSIVREAFQVPYQNLQTAEASSLEGRSTEETSGGFSGMSQFLQDEVLVRSPMVNLGKTNRQSNRRQAAFLQKQEDFLLRRGAKASASYQCDAIQSNKIDRKGFELKQNAFLRRQEEHLKKIKHDTTQNTKLQESRELRYLEENSVHRHSTLSSEDLLKSVGRLHVGTVHSRDRRLVEQRRRRDEEEIRELSDHSVHRRLSPSRALSEKTTHRLYHRDISDRIKRAGSRWKARCRDEEMEWEELQAKSVHAPVPHRLGIHPPKEFQNEGGEEVLHGQSTTESDTSSLRRFDYNADWLRVENPMSSWLGGSSPLPRVAARRQADGLVAAMFGKSERGVHQKQSESQQMLRCTSLEQTSIGSEASATDAYGAQAPRLGAKRKGSGRRLGGLSLESNSQSKLILPIESVRSDSPQGTDISSSDRNPVRIKNALAPVIAAARAKIARNLAVANVTIDAQNDDKATRPPSPPTGIAADDSKNLNRDSPHMASSLITPVIVPATAAHDSKKVSEVTLPVSAARSSKAQYATATATPATGSTPFPTVVASPTASAEQILASRQVARRASRQKQRRSSSPQLGTSARKNQRSTPSPQRAPSPWRPSGKTGATETGPPRVRVLSSSMATDCAKRSVSPSRRISRENPSRSPSARKRTGSLNDDPRGDSARKGCQTEHPWRPAGGQTLHASSSAQAKTGAVQAVSYLSPLLSNADAKQINAQPRTHPEAVKVPPRWRRREEYIARDPRARNGSPLPGTSENEGRQALPTGRTATASQDHFHMDCSRSSVSKVAPNTANASRTRVRVGSELSSQSDPEDSCDFSLSSKLGPSPLANLNRSSKRFQQRVSNRSPKRRQPESYGRMPDAFRKHEEREASLEREIRNLENILLEKESVLAKRELAMNGRTNQSHLQPENQTEFPGGDDTASPRPFPHRSHSSPGRQRPQQPKSQRQRSASEKNFSGRKAYLHLPPTPPAASKQSVEALQLSSPFREGDDASVPSCPRAEPKPHALPLQETSAAQLPVRQLSLLDSDISWSEQAYNTGLAVFSDSIDGSELDDATYVEDELDLAVSFDGEDGLKWAK